MLEIHKRVSCGKHVVDYTFINMVEIKKKTKESYKPFFIICFTVAGVNIVMKASLFLSRLS